MSDYKHMWEKLGLSLDAHAGLLAVLTEAYGNIYLAQKNRPKGMGYFDFVVSEIHGLRVKELFEAKEGGKKIVGTFCLYVPEEIILAVGGVSIGLCAGAEVGSAEAERFIPRNTCALIKAFMGFKLAGLCPYIELTDLIVGETTCDGKKKAYEIFNDITKKVYVMELPNMKSAGGKSLWLDEVSRFRAKMEDLTGNKITLERLKQAAAIINAKRRALQRLSRLRANDPCPISGLDALLVNQVAFYDDPVRFTEMTNKLCDELEARVRDGIGVAPKGTPRLLVSGSPMAIPNWKLHFITETSGGIIVGEESCVGERNHKELLDESFSDLDSAMEKISGRYMGINCACFTPNDGRIDDINSMYGNLHADGIINYSIQFCTTYAVESFKVEKALPDLKFLNIETDYSMGDLNQLKTRIESFIEILK